MQSPESHPSHEPVTRRRFIQFLVGFSAISTVAGMLTPVVAYLWPRRVMAGSGAPVAVGEAAAFPVNSSKIVSVNDKPVIVVHTKAAGLKAFSAICTHLGCVVNPTLRKGSIECPCHDAFFSPVTGAVVSGPPPRPLTAYEVLVKDGKVLVGKTLTA